VFQGSSPIYPFPRHLQKLAIAQGGAAFVALRDQLEEQFRAGFGEWHEAQLIDDEKLATICFWKRPPSSR
jgi:hypothetical protein